MALSGNVIPIKPVSDNQGLLSGICAQLNLLTEEYIFPLTSSLFPYLLSQLDEYLETATNNQDIMRLMDSRNSLKKNTEAIEEQLRSQLVMIHSEGTLDDAPLVLLDNDDLNHKLLWVSAAERMRTEDNLQLLFRIKKRFEQAFPDFYGSIPASPEKLCSSFSKVLTILESDPDLEQKLLSWFTTHIHHEADKLWSEVNELLNEAGLDEVEDKPNKESDIPSEPDTRPSTHSATAESYHSDHSSPQGGGISSSSSDSIISGLSDSMDSKFMDSLAESLVLRVEDMLVQDDIIPEAKMGRIRSIDLATVLNSLQLEVTHQHLSIINLNESIKTALSSHEGRNKLSRRHEDLISVVGLLFEYILDDHLLPKAVKKEIALLQIPILKLVIFDNNFLSDREHPARVLLNEMTSAGMTCQKDIVFTDPILSLIESTVRTIIAESQDDLTIFKRSLDRFRVEREYILNSEDIENEEIVLTSKVEDTIDEEMLEEEVTILREAEEAPSPENEPGLLDIDEAEYEEEIVLESGSGEIKPIVLIDTQETIQEEESNLEQNSEAEQREPVNRSFVTVTGIRPGQWVEFVGEGESHRMRCKLTKVHKETNRYFFENRSGMRVAEYTGYQLQKEIDQGIILVLEDHLIFDRALQAVMEKFKTR